MVKLNRVEDIAFVARRMTGLREWINSDNPAINQRNGTDANNSTNPNNRNGGIVDQQQQQQKERKVALMEILLEGGSFDLAGPDNDSKSIAYSE